MYCNSFVYQIDLKLKLFFLNVIQLSLCKLINDKRFGVIECILLDRILNKKQICPGAAMDKSNHRL